MELQLERHLFLLYFLTVFFLHCRINTIYVHCRKMLNAFALAAKHFRKARQRFARSNIFSIFYIFSILTRRNSYMWVNWRHNVETNIGVLLLEDPFIFNAENCYFFKSLKLFKQQNKIENKLNTLISTVHNLKYQDTSGNQVINCLVKSSWNQVINCLLMSRNQVINCLSKSSGNQVINCLPKSW